MAALVASAYVGVLAAVGLVALVAHVAFAGAAREWLDFGFPGVPGTLSASGSILQANLQVALVGVAGCFVAQWPWLAEGAGHAGGVTAPGRGWRAAARAADVVVALVVAGNVAIVGAAIGAYGERMVRAVLPHGPVELLGFAAVLGLYLHARRARVGWALAAALGGGAAVTLAVAAVLEAYFA